MSVRCDAEWFDRVPASLQQTNQSENILPSVQNCRSIFYRIAVRTRD